MYSLDFGVGSMSNIESQNKKFFHMAMTKERAWYYAIGMLQVDELEPSEEMMEMIEKEKKIIMSICAGPW